MAANDRPAAFAIKAAIADPAAARFAFAAQKTMYGGKAIAAGDTLYLFASETHGGTGLVARAVVTAADPTPPEPGLARQTPCVSFTADRTGTARKALGRAELRAFRGADDGSPEAELDFKFYRQATDKLVGVTFTTAKFLDGFF